LSPFAWTYCVWKRGAEQLTVDRGCRHRRAAAQGADVDLCVFDLVYEVQGRIGSNDEIDLLVVERHDDAQRTNRLARLGVASGREVKKRLVHVGLDERELDTLLEAQALHVFGRSRRGKHFELHVGRGSDELRQVPADLDVGAALRRRHDLVGNGGGSRLGCLARERRKNEEEQGEQSDSHFSLPPCG